MNRQKGSTFEVAERYAHRSLDGDGLDDAERATLAAVAQVHATLALVEAVERLTVAVEEGQPT